MAERSPRRFAESFGLGTSIANLAADAERKQRYIRLVRAWMLMLIVLAVGTWGYWHMTDRAHSLIQCLYMTVITISTVGFQEVIHVDTDALKLFTMGIILFGGASIAYFLTAIAAVIVEGDLLYRFWRRRLLTKLEGQRDHLIVCGLGLMGREVFGELRDSGVTTVGVDVDAERAELLVASHGADVLFVIGDAFEEETLLTAGLERARGLVAAFGADRDNLLLCVTAKQINPDLRVIVRLNHPENAELFDDVDVAAMVHPATLSGTRLANEALRPELVAFVDTLLSPEAFQHQIEEVVIPADSPVAGETLGAAAIVERSEALVIGHRAPGDDAYCYQPTAERELLVGSALLVLGSRRNRRRLRRLILPRRGPWERLKRRDAAGRR
ncbi:MAG: hypothetical protein CSA66_01350 [Proteobacteria bacterium]|nr:MAG: hypothetical protein CSA66_01350 [Pseudomonadota bacterium]